MHACRLMEALDGHLDRHDSHQRVLKDTQQAVAVCERALAKAQVCPSSRACVKSCLSHSLVTVHVALLCLCSVVASAT